MSMADINYFQLSWDEVKKLLKKRKSVQVNQNQCRLLTEKLVETLSTVRADIHSLLPWKQSLFCKQQCKAALQELYRVTREAEELVRACCNKDQLNIAADVKLVNNTESFAASFFRLEWCAAVIHIVTSDATTDTSSSNLRRKIMIEGFSTVEECESTMKAIRDMLKEAVLEDHRSLRTRLMEECGRRNEDEQEQQLIANMLELDPTQESSTFDSNEKKGASLKLPSIEYTQLEFFSEIGRGSCGDVFEASWLGQKVAVKTVHGAVTHETEISAGLSHPHIVRVFGVSTNKRHSCNLVMELMSGDLKKYIHHPRCDEALPFELDIAVDIMLQIAEGMQYLHDKQIVHRDLKSSNILVDPVDCSGKRYLRVKVADFGQAKIKAASATYSLQTKNVGTTRWMAPELLTSSDQRESSEPTPQELRYPFMVDVYSFAITCSEILTGDLPFNELQETLSNLRERVKEGLRPQLPASVPQCLVSLIQRCWDAEASNRPKFSEICVELRHLKASLMVGGEQLVRALQSPTSVSHIEQHKRRTMYQAFLAAAAVESDHVSESITRVLVILGSPAKSLSKTTFMAELCNMHQNVLDSIGPNLLDLDSEAMDINKEWKHPALPLCIHVSNGIGDSGQLESIDKFLRERNASCTFSSWLPKWAVSLREDWDHHEHGQQPMDTLNRSNRIHAVWILYSVDESIYSKWIHSKWNFLDQRGFLFPNVQALPDHFIVLPLKRSLSSDNMITKDLQMIRQLQRLDHQALWASSEVINTKVNIEHSAQIICKIAAILGKRGINIAITPYTTLKKSYSLTQSGIFTFRCLCEIFQVPKKMENAMFRKLASWESCESGTTSFSITDGKYLHFSIRVAAVILYCKALHCKGWTHNDFSHTNYSSELDNFYGAYGHQFEEFAKNAHFGIPSQIRKMLHSSNLEKQLQISLERFFVNVLNCSP